MPVRKATAQTNNNKNSHCVKPVGIWSYYGPYFPAFGLNTKRYGQIRTRITPNMDTFFAVVITAYLMFSISLYYSKKFLLFFSLLPIKIH